MRFDRLALLVIVPIVNAAHQLPLSPQKSTTSEYKAQWLSNSKYGVDELFSLHKSLVEIESISGNEKAVGYWLSSYLKDSGFTVELQEVAPKRYNVLAWPGEKKQTAVLVTSHIDTVPPFWPYKHWDNGTISGRGTVDAKGSVAAQIIAVLSLLESKSIPRDTVSLLYVVAEEVGGEGMLHFSDINKESGHAYESVIFGEPTEGKLVSGHKGILGLRFRVRGKAAHSGYPWLGLSANDYIVDALAALKALQKDLPKSEKYGETTVNIGRITGGVAGNVVAETAEANIAIRIAGGTPNAIFDQILGAVEKIKAELETKGGELIVERTQDGYPPVDMSCDVDGFDCLTVNYGTDVPNLSGHHKKYLYGPGTILVAHSDHEALTEKELKVAVEGYQKLVLNAVTELKS